MSSFVDVLLSIGIFVLFAVGCGSMIKIMAFRSKTPDGDSFANRMLGHGPDDEVYYNTSRTRISRLFETSPPDRRQNED
jgi:hypothetical protein